MFRQTFKILAIISPSAIACCAQSHREKELNESIYKVSDRLKRCLDSDNIICSKIDKDGIQICKMKTGMVPTGGLPNMRIAKARIRAPVDEVCAVWFAHGDRKNWDKVCSADSQVVEEYNSESRLVYNKGRAGYVCPARDFAFNICRVPGGMVGLRDFMSVAFINVDASTVVPPTASAVRAKHNSILVLQPINAETTEVTYVVEVQANGWIPSFVAEFFADNLVSTLRSMKAELEAAENNEEASATIEEAARLRFKRHLAQKEGKHSTTIINDVTSNVEDLRVAKAALEKKLQEIRKAKSTEGLDLSELENRVKKDLNQISERIRQAQNTQSTSAYQSPKWGSVEKK